MVCGDRLTHRSSTSIALMTPPMPIPIASPARVSPSPASML
jgi:hypothetical protein